MNGKRILTQTLAVGLCLGAVAAATGCRRNPNKIPFGAIPQPIGTHSQALFALQAQKAEADDFVFYQHEWKESTAQLGPFGQRHLEMVTRRLPEEQYIVVLEPHADEAVNEARRLTMVQLLQFYQIPDAESRVMVAHPLAEGLTGEEAAKLQSRMNSGK